MATDNFGFTTLLGTDTAGYNTINTLITSIDTVLKDRVFAADRTWANTAGDGDGPSADEVMIFTGSFGSGGYWKAGLVSASNMASDAITTAKILDANVTAAKLATDSVTTAKIADNAITNAKLANDSVGTAELQDGSVSQAKLTVGLAQQTLPAGMISSFAGASAPAGWVLCNGAAVPRTGDTYGALFDVIGTAYGSGDGSTTFNLPNLQGRIPVGKSAEAEFDVLGETGGSKSVTLTANQSGLRAHTPTGTVASQNANVTIQNGGSHTHGITDPGHGHVFKGDAAATQSGTGVQRIYNKGSSGADMIYSNTTGISIQTGGGHEHGITQTAHSHGLTMDEVAASNAIDSHTNLQPYVIVNYIIKL